MRKVIIHLRPRGLAVGTSKEDSVVRAREDSRGRAATSSRRCRTTNKIGDLSVHKVLCSGQEHNHEIYESRAFPQFSLH